MIRYLTLFGSSWTVSIEAKTLFPIRVHTGLAVLDEEVHRTLARGPGADLAQVTVTRRLATLAPFRLQLKQEDVNV